MNASPWRQLTLIHLSDLHFGVNHSFNPPGGGDQRGRPTLAESILKDLAQGQFAIPSEFSPVGTSERKAQVELPRVVLAITGDFNERCLEPEFEQARRFLTMVSQATIFGHTLSAQDGASIASSIRTMMRSARCVRAPRHNSLTLGNHPGCLAPSIWRKMASLSPKSTRALTFRRIRSTSAAARLTMRQSLVSRGSSSSYRKMFDTPPSRSRWFITILWCCRYWPRTIADMTRF
jgi:hypothetical protein